MKVLLVNKFHYKKGGSETYYFTLAEALQAKGHDVIFFAMKDDEKNISCEQDDFFVSNASVNGGIKSKINMILHIAYSKEAYTKMKALLVEEKPDLVIFNLVHKQITLSIIDAIKEYNKELPIFWTMHDLITVCPAYTMLNGNSEVCEKCLGGNFKNCIKSKCIKGSTLMSYLSVYEAEYIKKKNWYNKVDLYICPSEFYKRKLEEANFTNSKIITLRNPLPINTKYECSVNNEGYILYFGRLSKEKGVKTLIDAVKNTEYRLVIVGTGPIADELNEYARDYHNIEFKGFQTGKILEDYIKNSKCVVLPSEWYENGPYSAMEAMAAGKPLVVSDNGGLPELVKDGKNGFIYSMKEEGALNKCIERIMNLNSVDYNNMCNYSVKIAKEMFSAEQYVEQIERHYTEERG